MQRETPREIKTMNHVRDIHVIFTVKRLRRFTIEVDVHCC